MATRRNSDGEFPLGETLEWPAYAPIDRPVPPAATRRNVGEKDAELRDAPSSQTPERLVAQSPFAAETIKKPLQRETRRPPRCPET